MDEVERMKVSEAVNDLFSDGMFLLSGERDRSIDHGAQIPSFAVLEKYPVGMITSERNKVFVHTKVTVALSFLSKGVHNIVGFAMWVLQNSETILHKPDKVSW